MKILQTLASSNTQRDADSFNQNKNVTISFADCLWWLRESRAKLKRKITVRIDQTIYNGAVNEFSAPLYANVLRLLRQEVPT